MNGSRANSGVGCVRARAEDGRARAVSSGTDERQALAGFQDESVGPFGRSKPYVALRERGWCGDYQRSGEQCAGIPTEHERPQESQGGAHCTRMALSAEGLSS